MYKTYEQIPIFITVRGNKNDVAKKNCEELKFSYFEPTFTEEFIIGYNNGIVEILNPSWEKEKIKIMFDEKYKENTDINNLKKEAEVDGFKHEESVVQIKLSDYYPFYVSIAEELIIYQLKK